MATDSHGNCPHCGVDLNGGSIWQTMLEQSGGDEAEADRKAAMYGATRTSGQWGRQIGIYSMESDRTVSYVCPDCKGEWPR
jgi:predicted RNA-binding Zn-ribbon protein involved in translation (DUF1610 family)